MQCVDTRDEAETEVNGWETACEFYQAVRYVDNTGKHVDISQLIPLVDLSTGCRQLVKWRCKAATINSPNSAHRMTYWRNRNGQETGYWGGASPVAVGR